MGGWAGGRVGRRLLPPPPAASPCMARNPRPADSCRSNLLEPRQQQRSNHRHTRRLATLAIGCLQELLRAGASAYVKDEQGETVLHCATRAASIQRGELWRLEVLLPASACSAARAERLAAAALLCSAAASRAVTAELRARPPACLLCAGAAEPCA
jgi:hypothetical protein